MDLMYKDAHLRAHAAQQGFTLLEAAIALVMLMVIGLGIASLFTYAVQANTRADDRELSMAIAQKRMEWLRTIPFTTQTRHGAFSFPDGGLEKTGADGVTETVINAGRSYVVNTVIEDITFVPAGAPDAGEPTVKRMQVSVTPVEATAFETVTITTQRSTQVAGIY
jgi:type II secretory pathway pseudopilin PulG